MKRFVRGMSAALLLALAFAAVGAQEFDDDDWVRYSSLCVAFPIVNREVDIDGTDVDFEGNCYAFDYSAHHVKGSGGFTVLARCGFGYLDGNFGIEDYEEDFDGFSTYFKLGFGKAFELADRRVAIIPTGGVGIILDLLNVSRTEVWGGSSGEYEDETDFFAFDVTVDLFLNVMASFMFSENFGLTASCEISTSAFGIGYLNGNGMTATNGEFYSPNIFAGVSFTPAVGICLRF